jgi:hypothetical protein
MNAEKDVPIFGSKWHVEVHVFGSILQYGSFVNPQSLFGGINCNLVANLWLRRGLQPKLQNKEHTVYGSLGMDVAEVNLIPTFLPENCQQAHPRFQKLSLKNQMVLVGVGRSMLCSKGISDVSSMANESENDQGQRRAKPTLYRHL